MGSGKQREPLSLTELTQKQVPAQRKITHIEYNNVLIRGQKNIHFEVLSLKILNQQSNLFRDLKIEKREDNIFLTPINSHTGEMILEKYDLTVKTGLGSRCLYE